MSRLNNKRKKRFLTRIIRDKQLASRFF